MFSHHELHERAVRVSSQYLKCESELISILQELDQVKTFMHYKEPSLFAYATHQLKLSTSTALTLIGIARKSVEIPELQKAIEEKTLDIGNARRIVPILTVENKSHWIAQASSLTQDKLNQALAKKFPERAAPPKVKYKSETLARIETDVTIETLELLKRAQDLLSQKEGRAVDLAHALEKVLGEFVERNDPEKKARRVKVKNERTVVKPITQTESQSINAKRKVLKRVPIPAAVLNAVNLRDQNRCTQLLPNSSRCTERRWLHFHHIKKVELGGTNEVENLRTLCAGHHRMVHKIGDFDQNGKLARHDRHLK